MTLTRLLNRRRLTTAYAATFAVVLLAAAPLPAQARPRDPFAGFDTYATQAMQAWKVPGMAIAVVKGDSVLWARGYGVRTVGDTARVDPSTMFAIGSASKAFTGAAIGMLADERKLSLDRRVVDYLPYFQLHDPWVTREMRVRDLLLHNSGLSRGEAIWYGTTRSREETIRAVRHLVPTASFRAKFQYQNIMYIAAGEVIHTVSGQSWDDFIRTRFFAPLGMNASNTSVRELVGRGNVATPHADLGQGVQPIAWRNIDNAAAAGSINSNVLDMTRWLRLWLGKGKFGGRQLLSPAIADEAIAEHMVVNDPLFHLRLMRPRFLTYGYGWFITEHRGRRMVTHGGNIDGMAALVSFLPDDGVGVVILTNMNQSDITIPLTANLYDRLLGIAPKDYSAEYLAAAEAYAAQSAAGRTPPPAAEATRPSLPLAAYVGTYDHPMLGPATVALDASGALTVSYDAHPTANGTLQHVRYDSFVAALKDSMLGKVPVTFQLGVRGEVEAMRFALGGDDPWRRRPSR